LTSERKEQHAILLAHTGSSSTHTYQAKRLKCNWWSYKRRKEKRVNRVWT